MERIIISRNGILEDITNKVNAIDEQAAVIEYNHLQDYLYVGSYYPFNSIHFDMDTLNTNAATAFVEYWRDSAWEPVVNSIDSSEGLTKSGTIQFVPNKKESWSYEDTEEDGVELITGLGDITIYDLYWLKISFSASFSAGSSIKYIGQKFCLSSDVYIEYPELSNSNLLAAIGVTDWSARVIQASTLMIDDLIRKGIIEHESQLLDWKRLRSACVSKTGEIIYGLLGDDYKDQRDIARKEYESRTSKNIFITDKNNDGLIDKQERKMTQGVVSR